MSFLKKAQQQIAHNTLAPSLVGNSDLKTLQAVITSEKEFIKSTTKCAGDFGKNLESLKSWGNEEGEGIRDVLNKLTVLWEHYPSALNRLNTHLSTIRLHFKAVRTREETLSEMKSRKRSIASRIESVEKKLAKMGPENKELAKTTGQLKDLRNEYSTLSNEVLVEEAALDDFKRRSVKESLSIKCSALVELAEKMIVMAEMAGAMLEELDMEPRQPGQARRMYTSALKTDDILQDGLKCLSDVTFRPINTLSPGASVRNGAAAGGAGTAGQGHPDRTLSASEMTYGAGGAGGMDGYDYGSGSGGAYSGANGYASANDPYGTTSTTSGYGSGANNALAASSSGDNVPPLSASTVGPSNPWTASSQQQQQQHGTSSGAAGVGPSGSSNADDWGMQALGAIGSAGKEVRTPDEDDGKDRFATSTLTPTSGTAALDASSGSRSSPSAAANASGAGPTDPIGRTAHQTGEDDSRDSLADLAQGYGRIPAPIIANSTGGAGDATPPAAASDAAAAAAGPSGVVDPAAEDEESLRAYFKSIGSTRAAQEAVRRPGSAGGATAPARYSVQLGSSPLAGGGGAAAGAGSSAATAGGAGVGAPPVGASAPENSYSSNTSSAPSGGASAVPPAVIPALASSGSGSSSSTIPAADDDPPVKKVTAGAFRKGFGRNVSGQGTMSLSNINVSGLTGGPGTSRPTTPGSQRPSFGSGTGEGAPQPSSSLPGVGAVPVGAAPVSPTRGQDVAPLQINKRHSSVDMNHTLTHTSGTADAAPPYQPQPGPQTGARQDNAYTHSVYGGMAPAAAAPAPVPSPSPAPGSVSPGGYADPNAPAPGQYGAPSQQYGYPAPGGPPPQHQQPQQPAYMGGGGQPGYFYHHQGPPAGAGGYQYGGSGAGGYSTSGYSDPYANAYSQQQPLRQQSGGYPSAYGQQPR